MQSNIKILPLADLGQKIVDLFSQDMERLARQTQFVQRKSPLTGLKFLKATVFGFLENAHASLADLAQVCQDLGVSISPQGIDERFNRFSVAFLQQVFCQAIQVFQNQIPLVLPIRHQFSAIYLVDSTVLALPATLQEAYPGCGGGASTASLKIQLVFEFLYGNLKQIAFQAGREPDQGYRDYLSLLVPGSLTMADLGYFCLDAFRTIMAGGAYFLSRYHYSTALLTPEGERIDLLAWLRTETRSQIDRPVLLGSRPQHRLPGRLIVLQACQAVVEERRRKAIEKSHKMGRVPTQDYLALLEWSLFVTNVPAEQLSIPQVICLYRVRWQIELIFKLWKSYAGLSAQGLWRKDRVLTEIYAKMIGLVLLHFLLAPLRIPHEVWDGREISAVQAKKILARFALRLNQSLAEIHPFMQVLSQMLDCMVRFGLKQKRVAKPNVCQSLATSLA